jgi:hypothetical protein
MNNSRFPRDRRVRFWQIQAALLVVCVAAVLAVSGRSLTSGVEAHVFDHPAVAKFWNKGGSKENAATLSLRGSSQLSAGDQAFLEDLSRRAFRYFWEQADPQTGLVRDRARTDGSPHDERHRDIASIAATGFGLTALCIAADHHWIDPAQARRRARAALRFLARLAPQENGWFYHWMDAKNGERRWNSEVSSIDSALLLGGILTVRQYFQDDAEMRRLAREIYQRIDFPWMLNGDPGLLSHGWTPERGFIAHRWDHYSEQMILYLLAIGSSVHPISPSAWYAWHRPEITYRGFTYITGGPLFIHQYSHAWIDFRDRREERGSHADYFENSIAATRAHRLFCIDLSGEFPGYSENIWGITASDSPKGYRAWGGPPRDPAIDGTVVPCAPAGSLMFTPEISLPALQTMRARFGDQIYGRYGFADAFNPTTGWVGPDVIGINVGITLLSAENLRSGGVWRWFMRNPEIPRAMKMVGLVKVNERRRKIAIQYSPQNRRIAPLSFDLSELEGAFFERKSSGDPRFKTSLQRSHPGEAFIHQPPRHPGAGRLFGSGAVKHQLECDWQLGNAPLQFGGNDPDGAGDGKRIAVECQRAAQINHGNLFTNLHFVMQLFDGNSHTAQVSVKLPSVVNLESNESSQGRQRQNQRHIPEPFGEYKQLRQLLGKDIADRKKRKSPKSASGQIVEQEFPDGDIQQAAQRWSDGIQPGEILGDKQRAQPVTHESRFRFADATFRVE